MRHIVVDLEWNQPTNPHDSLPCGEHRKLEGDIIQIGAVVLDDELNITGKLNLLVKPDFYTRMSKRVAELTGITDEVLKAGIPLKQALPQLRALIIEGETAFYSWGLDDLRVMRENCHMYDEPQEWLTPWYNLQLMFGLQNGAGKTQKALKTALETFEITTDLRAHDALNDALFAAMVMQKLDMEKALAMYPTEGKRKKKPQQRRHRGGHRRPLTEPLRGTRRPAAAAGNTPAGGK